MEQDVARARTARSSRMRCTRAASSNGDPASGRVDGIGWGASETAIDSSFGFLAHEDLSGDRTSVPPDPHYTSSCAFVTSPVALTLAPNAELGELPEGVLPVQTWWPGPGSNRRPSTFQADARTD